MMNPNSEKYRISTAAYYRFQGRLEAEQIPPTVFYRFLGRVEAEKTSNDALERNRKAALESFIGDNDFPDTLEIHHALDQISSRLVTDVNDGSETTREEGLKRFDKSMRQLFDVGREPPRPSVLNDHRWQQISRLDIALPRTPQASKWFNEDGTLEDLGTGFRASSMRRGSDGSIRIVLVDTKNSEHVVPIEVLSVENLSSLCECVNRQQVSDVSSKADNIKTKGGPTL